METWNSIVLRRDTVYRKKTKQKIIVWLISFGKTNRQWCYSNMLAKFKVQFCILININIVCKAVKLEVLSFKEKNC